MVSTQENTDKKAPLLSIGMIFKNEERCLERCLQALTPLREAIPCELVMADTGSTDSSREIAAKYADILFDFPWINDFSAARNAVMDRCSGKWFLTVDADEYLDADVSLLTNFLIGAASDNYDFVRIIQRNYRTAELSSDSFSDCYITRMMRMATKQRYQGSIHESFPPCSPSKILLLQVVLHHDGYVNEEISHKKGMRNLPLLEAELEAHPNDIRLAKLALDSSYTDEQLQKYGNLIVQLIKKRVPNWELFGPPALRRAILLAGNQNLPVVESWLAACDLLTIPTPFYYVDIVFFKALYYQEQGDLLRCLEEIQNYQNGLARWLQEKDTSAIYILSYLYCDTPTCQRHLYLLAAECHAKLKQWEEVFPCLQKAASFTENWDISHTSILTNVLILRKAEGLDVKPILEHLNQSARSSTLKELVSFLLTDTPAQAEALLASITDYEAVSPLILEHALTLGASFPDTFYNCPVESMQKIITQVLICSGNHSETLRTICNKIPAAASPAQIAWNYHLTAAIIQTYAPEDQNFSTIYAVFLKQIKAYLETFYQPEILTEACIYLLPQNIRFSWYILQAHLLLKNGAVADCVRCLRAGLQIAPHTKPLVQYLLEQVNKPPEPEPVSAELMMLAEKIRSILSAFPPDDPSVLALKASPVYQQVAHLIENNT